jgi:hypothetical protein
MLTTLVLTLLAAGEPAAQLPGSVAKEMTEAVIAVNKVLGLETWAAHGEEPCVDRGGLEATIRDISPEETRQCASTALAKGFLGLGKNYWIGIPMAGIGPVTVFAIGREEAEGWGAYSCDPSRKCNPTKLNSPSKQAKRLVERYHRACLDPKTVWFPDREGVCEGTATIPDSAPTPPPVKSPPPAAKSATPQPSSPTPWPVKE